MLKLIRIIAMVVLSTVSIQSLAFCEEIDVAKYNYINVTQTNTEQAIHMDYNFRTSPKKDELKNQNRRNVVILIITSVVMASLLVAFSVRN